MTWLIGVFYIMMIFLGFGVVVFVGNEVIIKVNLVGNMVVFLLVKVLGGDFLFVFVLVIVFVMILVVVVGFVLIVVLVFVYDFYNEIICKGKLMEKE